MTFQDIVPSVVRSAIAAQVQAGQLFKSTELHQQPAIRAMHPDLQVPGHRGGLPILARCMAKYGDLFGIRLVDSSQPDATWLRVS